MQKSQICSVIISFIQSFLDDLDGLHSYADRKSFVRKRFLSLRHVVFYLLFSTKASMYKNISAIKDSLEPLSFPNVSKMAVSKARQHIAPALFEHLFRKSVNIFHANCKNLKTWHSYVLFAVDGSRIQLPNSVSNFHKFGCCAYKDNPDKVWSLALASLLYNVLDDYIFDAYITRHLASERDLAQKHIDFLSKKNLKDKSIIIFDRGYYSENMFRRFYNSGLFCVMRLKDGLKICQNCPGDYTTFLPGSKKKHTDDIKIRVVAVPLPSGITEYLATNIFDESLTPELFKELYFYRWPIEEKYQELKLRFKLEEFNGITAISIQQEFFINLLLSNLVSLIKSEADEIKEKQQEESNNMHRYQANRTFIIGRFREILPKILCGLFEINKLHILLAEAVNTNSQIQPGRTAPRKRIERKRAHFPNRKSTY